MCNSENYHPYRKRCHRVSFFLSVIHVAYSVNFRNVADNASQMRIFTNGAHPITPCASIVVAYFLKENAYACACSTD